MKFTIVVVMLAMVFATEASPSWGSEAHHDGWHGDWHGSHGISLSQGGWGGHGHHYSAPAYDHGHYDHHGHDHHHHHAHYVAKTLGAVHTAPLPGHKDSVKSYNVAAPPAGHHHW